MNPQRHAAAVTTALTTVEALADAQGWDAYPAVLGLFDSTSHTGVGSLDVEELPIDPRVWQLHAGLGPRLKLPYQIGFHAVVDVLATAKVTALRAWVHAQPGPCSPWRFSVKDWTPASRAAVMLPPSACRPTTTESRCGP
ncbi:MULTISPECIES: hypothetical protein [unclassified Micromonospora]|uniref:hypothetical protein n=1 Tax=unclassified Micromonospora TaxID=2617518 RepID=UPI001C223785|nr:MULTISPECIES: hypothetical protein [unclassified Micromonospora]MBU8857744.1 hypothetical protein [Micromonospora sp. WMMB482]MDM4783371.1 hypothetical protein [Micromonospora sp. b486]